MYVQQFCSLLVVVYSMSDKLFSSPEALSGSDSKTVGLRYAIGGNISITAATGSEIIS